MVYGHPLFGSGVNPISALGFSFPTLVITIPATIVVLIWTFSLYGSKLRINSASLFALGFISMFVSGGGSGFFLSPPPTRFIFSWTFFFFVPFPHFLWGRAHFLALSVPLLLLPQRT